MAIDKNQLISEITEAFNGVTLDGGIGLSEANAIDNYKEDRIRKECKKNDEKTNWSSISAATLNQYNSSLSFFDAKGMKFHLPAFLIGEINGEYGFGMAFSLTHLSDYSKSQFTLLSRKQRDAVTTFLEYLKEHSDYEVEKPEIEKAIESYWGN